MKKVLSIVLASAIILSTMPTIAFAAEEIDVDVSEEYSSFTDEYDSDKQFVESIVIADDADTLELNGAEIPADNSMSVVDDTPMISVDTLCKYIDAEYTDETKKTTGYSTIEFADREVWFNETTGAIDIIEGYNDNIVLLDKTPLVKDGTVFVPLEEFSEAIGYDVTQSDDDENKFLLTRPYQTSRLIVSSKKNVDTLDSVASIRDNKDNITILQFDSETAAMRAEEYYNSLKGVVVEPDTVMFSCSDDSVESYAEILESYDNHYDTLASETIHIDDMNDYLSTQNLSDITVAVVDTGVCSSHPDLEDRIICADVNFSGSEQDNSEDDNGHGTHVTGIIVDNTLDNVKVLDVKVLDGNGRGTMFQVYQGMKYAVEQGSKVINLSLGAYGESQLLTDYVKELWQKNITVVAAAGNNNWFADEFTPGGIPQCITVGAGKAGEGRFEYDLGAPFTNGQYPVDITAPGVDIYSTYIFDEEHPDGYATLSGTSMSAPFVSAVAGMLYSYDSSYTAEYVHSQIKSNYQEDVVIRMGFLYWNPETREKNWQYGYLDCANLIDYPRTAAPKASFETGYYTDFFDVELSCSDDDAEIYYTLDGTRASKENGALYTEPIHLEDITRLHAVAYSEGKFKSLQTYYDYYVVMTADERAFTINADGIITSFDNTIPYASYLKVPDKINGITVRGVGDKVFKNGLKVIHLPDTCKSLGYDALGGSNPYGVIAKGVTKVGAYTFQGKTLCSVLEIGELEEVGEYAFAGCPITEISGEKLTEIPEGAFEHTRLVSAYFPNVIKVGNYGFAGCPRLEHINLDKAESLGDYAFANSHVGSVSFPNVKKIGTYIFKTSSVMSVSMPVFEDAIPEYAFYDCGIIDVDIPNATAVQYMAFFNCDNLRELVMNKVKTIVGYAFTNCNNLTKIELDSVESMSGFTGAKVEKLYFPNLIHLGRLSSDHLKYLSLPKCETVTHGINAPNLIDAELPELTTIGTTASDNDAILFKDCMEIEELNLPKLKTVNGLIYYVSTKEDRAICKIKRINAPIICQNKDERITEYLRNKYCALKIAEDLPEYSSSLLKFDVIGYTLSYKWYYSETGEEGSFYEIPNTNSMVYKPRKLGFYYAIATQMNRGVESTLTSSVCKFGNEKFVRNTVNLDVSSINPFSATIENITYEAEKQSNNLYNLNLSVDIESKVLLSYPKEGFIAWTEYNNSVKSLSALFSFKIISDTKLFCKTKNYGTVTFYNNKEKEVMLSSNSYSLFTENDFPSAPNLYGHHFVRWSRTVDEINEAIKNGESIDVYAEFEKDLKYYSLLVYDGEVIDTDSDRDNGKDSYREFSYVKIRPKHNEITPFYCWKDEYGNILSYLEEYTFYMTNDTKIFAIYSDNQREKQAITRITNTIIDEENARITFIAEREVPKDREGIVHGIILTNNPELDENSFVIGAENVLVGRANTHSHSGTYVLYKSNVSSGETWYARSYIYYTNKDGDCLLMYSKIHSATMA